MAKRVITRADLLLASQLSAAGIPVHEEALEKMRVACYRTDRRGLLISQCGGMCDRAFSIPGYGTGYVMYIKMVSRGGMVALCDVELRLPWADRYFEWLGDPDELYRRKYYSFPGKNCLDYPKEEVVNHFVFGRRRLRYGDFIEGALLGFSAERIPDCFQHGYLLEAELIVTDQLDIEHRGEVTLYVDRDVDRSAELTQGKHKPRRRRERIFDESEDPDKVSCALAGSTA